MIVNEKTPAGMANPTGAKATDKTDQPASIVDNYQNVRKDSERHGATPTEWTHFDLYLGLTADLLPVVSDPNAGKSPHSRIKEPGKLPSRFNRRGEMVGFPKWTEHHTKGEEIETWSKDSRLGICLQTRRVRAIDVDVNDAAQAAEIEKAITEHLGYTLPCRRRPNSSKFLMVFELPGDLTKRRFEAENGFIEFLATGQQAIVIGRHPSGVHYEWDGGLPLKIPALDLAEFEALWTVLVERFAIGDSVTVRKGITPEKKRQAEDISDPLVKFLVDNWTVHNIAKDGRVDLVCPFEENHSTDSGTTSTSYYPAGVGGFQRGHWKCLHASCAHRTDQDFNNEIGYTSHGFDALPPLTPAEEEEQARIQKRNAESAEREASAAIERARFSSGRTPLETARRDYQKAENERIGEGAAEVPPAEVIAIGEALQRFVFLADGARVVDLFNPHYDLKVSDWAETYRASVEMVPQPDKFRADGGRIATPAKRVQVTDLWRNSEKRKTAVCRTFKAGGEIFLADPNNRRAVNTWRGFDRSVDVDDIEAAGVRLFTDHVDFLFGADAARFLDWLAHIEQNPGVLPHTAWLHIAPNFGMGRNWLASVLARVWAGYVAPNFDLVGTLKNGFNERLSGKVLAIIDEIREGGRDSRWEHAEKLKSLFNEEQRTVNTKCGRISVEYNACRWLMFSNHKSAIPMEKGDRRVEVCISEARPRNEAYYTRLYSALSSPRFIAAVARFLGTRNIAHFNPGAHAKLTAAKEEATKASQTPAAQWCETLIAHWPSDLITAGDLFEVLEGARPTANNGLNASHRMTLEFHRITAIDKKVRLDSGPIVRLSIVRNHERWQNATPDEWRKELQRAPIGGGARTYLEEIAAV